MRGSTGHGILLTFVLPGQTFAPYGGSATLGGGPSDALLHMLWIYRLLYIAQDLTHFHFVYTFKLYFVLFFVIHIEWTNLQYIVWQIFVHI